MDYTKIITIHRLVSAENTLYRIDARRKVIWKYTEDQFMFDCAFIKATDLVYGTAGDNTKHGCWFADAGFLLSQKEKAGGGFIQKLSLLRRQALKRDKDQCSS